MLYLAMDVYSQSLYKEFKQALDASRQVNSNLLIVTVPGSGISYFAKSYLKKTNLKDTAYITKPNQTISKLNILDIDFLQDSSSLEIVNDYLKHADIDQKFIVILNRPSLLDTPEYKNSYLSSHIYSTFYFHTRSLVDTAISAREFNSKLTDSDIKDIFSSSAGIGKLIKFKAINPKLPFPQDILLPIINTIKETSPEILSKLEISSDWPALDLVPSKLNININFDLTFTENNQLSANTLTKEERDILNYMLTNDNQTSREKVAEFKWGENGYDDFSDQAINKSMRRLAEKLTKFIIETIPKVGYKIIECHQ